MATKVELIEIFWAAIAAPLGIVVHTSDPDHLRKKLVHLRTELRKAGQDDFDSLQFRSSPIEPNSELWILPKQKKEPNQDAEG